MMRSLLARLQAGEDLETLLPLIDAAVPRQQPTTMDDVYASMVDKHVDLDDGWADVEVARLLGDITEEQYARIRAYVVGD